MRFDDVHVSRDDGYALGVERESGRCYLSIPVSNRRVDYEERYELDAAELERLRGDPAAAAAFADACRRHEHDDRLFLPPGRDRGAPG